MKIEAKLVLAAVLVVFVGIVCDCNAENSLDSNQQQPALKFSKDTGFGNLEVSLKYDAPNHSPNSNFAQSSDHQNQGVLNPEISIFSSSKRDYPKYNFDNNQLNHRKVNRSDRYKDTIPAVFRVTVKGYSIMEHSNKKTDTWTLNKMSGKAFRKPEIMFSVTKRF